MTDSKEFKCDLCGTPVRVVSDNEGTSHYEPIRSRPEGTQLSVEEIEKIINDYLETPKHPKEIIEPGYSDVPGIAQAIHARLGSLVPIDENNLRSTIIDFFEEVEAPSQSVYSKDLAKYICKRFGAKQSVRVPEKKNVEKVHEIHGGWSYEQGEAKGFNEAIDEIYRLNPHLKGDTT